MTRRTAVRAIWVPQTPQELDTALAGLSVTLRLLDRAIERAGRRVASSRATPERALADVIPELFMVAAEPLREADDLMAGMYVYLTEHARRSITRHSGRIRIRSTAKGDRLYVSPSQSRSHSILISDLESLYYRRLP